MLSGPLVKPPLGDQDVTRYPHGRTWDITSVVLLLYMVAPPQGSIRRRMGIGVEESAEVGKLCRHRAAEAARCRWCVSVSQHANCEVFGPLERRDSVAVLVIHQIVGIQASFSVNKLLSDPAITPEGFDRRYYTLSSREDMQYLISFLYGFFHNFHLHTGVLNADKRRRSRMCGRFGLCPTGRVGKFAQ